MLALEWAEIGYTFSSESSFSWMLFLLLLLLMLRASQVGNIHSIKGLGISSLRFGHIERQNLCLIDLAHINIRVMGIYISIFMILICLVNWFG